jgi:NAD(P)-dependent dehydrogenase (short-subunit alcohol dehydrogenase family)
MLDELPHATWCALSEPLLQTTLTSRRREYGASKFAVEALTDSLRYKVSQLGIEVVEVQPSTYPTTFWPAFRGLRVPK